MYILLLKILRNNTITLEVIMASCILKNDSKNLEMFFNCRLDPVLKKEEEEHLNTEKGIFCFDSKQWNKSELEVFNEETGAVK